MWVLVVGNSTTVDMGCVASVRGPLSFLSGEMITLWPLPVVAGSWCNATGITASARDLPFLGPPDDRLIIKKWI